MARVLVIDDSPLVRIILCDYLRDLGHEALATDNAQEGLALCSRHSPDLVFKDLVMKDADLGIYIQDLRRQNKRLPIIVCSTMTRRHEVCEAIKAGADDFLVKPFVRRDVANLVSRYTVSTQRSRDLV